MANLNQDADASIFAMVTIAVAAFPIVTLSGGAAKRMGTAIVANNNTNKQILSEAADLLAVTMVGSPTYFTTLGRARRELESVQAVGTTTY